VTLIHLQALFHELSFSALMMSMNAKLATSLLDSVLLTAFSLSNKKTGVVVIIIIK
jgi:hypothetical protein